MSYAIQPIRHINGFKVIHEHYSELPIVNFEIVLRRGSAHDRREQEGITNLMLRSLLAGTKKRDRDKIADDVDFIGSDIDIDVTREYSTIGGSVIRENLDTYLEILSDVIHNPTFESNEIENIRNEIVSEIESDIIDDNYLVNKHFRKFLLQDHGYGNYDDGTKKSLSFITKEHITNLYREVFSIDNIIVMITGDITLKECERLLMLYFGTLENRTSRESGLEEPKISKNGSKVLVVDKPERLQSQIMLGHLGYKINDPHFYDCLACNHAFGGMYGSVLSQEVRINRGLSYGCYANNYIRSRRSEYTIWTFPDSKNVISVIDLLIDLYKKLLYEGVSEKMLERAKKNLIHSFAFNLETPMKRAMLTLKRELYGLDEDYYRNYKENIKSTVNRAFSKALPQHFSLDNIRMTIVCTANGIAKELEKYGDVEVIAYDEV